MTNTRYRVLNNPETPKHRLRHNPSTTHLTKPNQCPSDENHLSARVGRCRITEKQKEGMNMQETMNQPSDEIGVFSMRSYTDLLRKCGTELDSLETCSEHPQREYLREYLLFNLVFGLNHTFDWFICDKSNSPDAKIDCVRRFNPYTKLKSARKGFPEIYKRFDEISFPETNAKQEAVRKICNSAKHFRVRGKRVEQSSTHYLDGCGEPNMQCGEPEALCGNFHFQYSVSIAGKDVDLECVLSSLYKQWAKFAGLEQPATTSSCDSITR